MWKFVTRGIRETLERRASCRTNVYSQTSGDNGHSQNEVKVNFVKEQKCFVPRLIASCNNGFCGSRKSSGPKDKKYDSDWQTRRSWPEAVGWSSALAIGWVVCQSLCLRRRLFEHSKEERWHSRLLKLHSAQLSLIDTLNLQPHYIFPVTNCVADHSIGNRTNSSNQEWVADKPYGPITIEEALKEAKDEYTRTHRIVMGEFELRFGVKALEEKRYEDAVKHFSTGASLSSSGSMFNLGLCHELGIGTATDLIKAAKYYRNAANRGHPDAMYNLGVFHAQGRGGLKLNLNKARELFVKAADLGQQQAQTALEMEKSNNSFRDNSSEILRDDLVGSEKLSNSSELCNESCSKKSFFKENIESVENATEMFLRTLGIRSSPQPIIVGHDESNMSYYT